MKTTIGTDNVSVSVLSDGTYRLQTVSFSLDNSSLLVTSDKLIINGQALTVYKSLKGNYVLACIFNLQDTTSQSKTYINGNSFNIINGCLSATNIETDNINYNNKTHFFNLPLMLDDNKKLVISQKEGDIQEYSTTSLGGNPIKIGRIGYDWFLIISIPSSDISYSALGTQDGYFLDFGLSLFI